MKSPRNNIKPPKWATKLFRYYCQNELSDSILGDLEEQFYLQVEKGKKRKAQWTYWSNVLGFINKYTLRKNRKPNYHHNNQTAMFKNYALITLRNLKRKPVFSFINIFGLALGLASCMIIFFHIQHELSYDDFHSNGDQIYKVTNIYERPGGTLVWGRTPPALAPAIRDNFAGIEKVTRLRYTDEHVYSVDEKIFTLDNSFYADSLFLEIFDFKLQQGNKSTALDDPNSIVLSQELAERFFGDENAIGRFIRFDNYKSLEVTGVFESLPKNSHIQFDFLLSFSTFEIPDGYLADMNSWGWAGFHTYIQLTESTDPLDLQQRVNALYQSNYTREDTKVNTPLLPLADLYLDSSEYTNVGASMVRGDKSILYTLSIIAVLVLVVAGFNFMNLSTAMSLGRGKEIGMRKVMGAVRGKIKIQFLVESMTVAFISLLIALIIVLMVAPLFQELLNIELPKTPAELLSVTPLFLVSTLIIGLLAGAYPSVVLSAFSPIMALKGSLKTSSSGTYLRKGLTVFQFVISVSLISGSLIVVNQMEFIRAKSLGFNQENILKITALESDMIDHYEEIKNRFLQNPHVSHVSVANHAFEGGASAGPAHIFGTNSDENHQLNYYQTGYDFQALTDLKLIQGRYFSRDFPNDPEQAMLLNESAVKAMGLTNPIGTRIDFNQRERVVVGVVKDFHYRSLHTPIAPLAIVMPFTVADMILVKTDAAPIGQTLVALEKEWQAVLENAPFDVTFLDEGIQRMYESEQRLSSLISIFATLAVVLASLGLYGLVAFSTQARLREVGIRKVLGASGKGVLMLLSRQFIGLILIANLIAWPLIYLLGNDWLNGFSYQIELGASHFLIPTILLLLIAAITLSHQVIKAALTNPVKVLRSE